MPSNREFDFLRFISLYHILVPIIQREYAQGRRNAPKSLQIRASFVPKLLSAIYTSQPISLDFVYGLTTQNDNDTLPTLMLLDGQQRITTLFLLAWYCGLQEQLKNWTFRYESRSVANEFIKQLYDTKNYDGIVSPSTFIATQPWFYLSWKNDPTVDGMLCMLDCIHEECIHKKYNRSSVDFTKITFYVHIINDEISIEFDKQAADYNKIFLKMNARGKALVTWENIKSILDQHVPKTINCPYIPIPEDSNFSELWKMKIDGDWQEDIWKFFSNTTKLEEHIDITNRCMLKIVKIALRRCVNNGIDGYNFTTTDFENWLEESENNTTIQEFYAICFLYFESACSEIFRQSWPTRRHANRLWAEQHTDKSSDSSGEIHYDESEFVNDLKFDGDFSFVNCIRFAIITEGIFANTSLRIIRSILNLLDNTSIDSIKYATSLQESLGILKGKKQIKDSSFSNGQIIDELNKSSCDENTILKLERYQLVWHGYLGFLYDNDFNIDGIEYYLMQLKNKIDNNWIDLYCTLLSAWTGTDGQLPQHYVQIPYKSYEIWAEEFFSLEHHSTAKLMHPGNIDINMETHSYRHFWCQHLSELLCKNDWDNNLKFLVQGTWIWVTSHRGGGSWPNAAARMAATDTERRKLDKMGLTHFNRKIWRRWFVWPLQLSSNGKKCYVDIESLDWKDKEENTFFYRKEKDDGTAILDENGQEQYFPIE